MYLTKKSHIHCIGIGGIGVSGIALILAQRGFTVSGCDLDLQQESIYLLKKNHISVAQGHNTALCHTSTITHVVYSGDIKMHHPELQRAIHYSIPIITRAQMLAFLMNEYQSIAIAGSHGKTTTTALITHLLQVAHLNPTFVIGGHAQNMLTNAQQGTGPFFVAEADESDRSLLTLKPTYAVITNISKEHLETYSDIEDIYQTFTTFAYQVSPEGALIACLDNPIVEKIIETTVSTHITYGIAHTNAHIRATDITLFAHQSQFKIAGLQKPNMHVTLAIPGKHNILNALAAAAVAHILNIDTEVIGHALSTFTGVDRRFTYRGTFFEQIEIFDDYGHHPNEIMQTLQVAKKRAQGKLIVLFQPHRFSRTYHLWNEFIQVFSSELIDTLIVTDIFSKGETPIRGVSAEQLVHEIKQHRSSHSVYYVPLQQNFSDIKNVIKSIACPLDLLLLLGAGKIHKMIDYLNS